MTMFFAKKLNKKGFTLAELLIVVAIIAVLIAIAVPIFTNSLEKARYSVHSSNARALKSLAISHLLGSDDFASYDFNDSDLWLAVGTYNYADETMKLVKVTIYKASGAKAGMWMKKGATADSAVDKDMDLGDWDVFVPNESGYKTIGRIGTGKGTGTVSFAIVFTNVDVSSVQVAIS